MGYVKLGLKVGKLGLKVGKLGKPRGVMLKRVVMVLPGSSYVLILSLS